jgi:RNA polymerase sigma-70 factor (sigma-E family)
LDAAAEFTEFASAATPRLFQTAFLLCGNWHTAQDLTQATLAKMFVSWSRIERRQAEHAYAHRVLVNCYLAMTRKRGFTETPVDQIAAETICDSTAELRIVLLQALAGLTPRDRAVLILRYWEDQSVDQVAELLGCSAGSVRIQSLRALDKLRAVLGGEFPEPGDRAAAPPVMSTRQKGAVGG